MHRVITYVDGFNLYFGMKQQFQNKYLWLDVAALSQLLLSDNQILAATKYFTSRVTRTSPTRKKGKGLILKPLKKQRTASFSMECINQILLIVENVVAHGHHQKKK
jgi:hypothetical protein